MENRETIAGWIVRRKYRGLYTFCVDDVMTDFPSLQYSYVFNALNRQIKHGTIISPVRAFYVIVPTEYALTGKVSATFYVDRMMNYLQRTYYIALLNAAEFYGAAHQRPQTFSIVHTPPHLVDGVRADIRFAFIKKNVISQDFIVKYKSRLGTVNVSSPELTALDLIANETKVGGLNRVCTVLNDLVDAFDTKNINTELLQLYSTPIYQRLGYILENIIEAGNLANLLYDRMAGSKKRLRAIPFKIGKQIDGYSYANRWKVIENQEIEIDE